VQGADAQDTLVAQNNLALLLLDIDKAADAEPMLRGVVTAFEKSFEPTHWLISAAKLNLGECLRELRRFDESERLALAAHEGLKSALGADHPRVSDAADNLADLYRDWGKTDEETRWRPAVTPTSTAPATQPDASG